MRQVISRSWGVQSTGSVGRKPHRRGLQASARAVTDALESRRLLAFTAPQSFAAPGITTAGDVAVADFNRDGNADVVVVNEITVQGSTGTMSVMLGVGDGTFHPSQSRTFTVPAVGFNTPRPYIADLNNDGNPDVLLAHVEIAAISFLGNGDGTFTEVATSRIQSLAAGATLNSLAMADFNNDGRVDVGAARGAVSEFDFYDGLGNGFFNPRRVVVTAPFVATGSVDTADFDRDGRPDIIFSASRTALFQIAFILSSQNYQTAGGFPSPGNIFDFAVSKAGVLSSSGAPAWVGGHVNQFYVMPNPTQSNAHVMYSGPSGINTIFHIGDVNRDGKADVLLGGQSSGELRLYFGNGDNTLGGYETIDLQASRRVAVGDFNNDGFPDVVRANEGTGFNVALQIAPSLVVTTAVDEDDGNAVPVNGTGTSLREAFNYARTLSGAQTITFSPSLGNANAVLNITGAPLVVDGLANPSALTIRNNAGTITLRGDGTRSLFDVRFLGNLTLDNLNITNFRASHPSGNGGVAYVAGLGTLNVSNTTFYGNSAAGEGSAIYSANGGVTFIGNSTFNANTGPSTIAIDSTSTFGLQHNTIVGNSAGVRAVAGTLNLSNNIIAGNGGADLSVGTGTFAGDRNIIQTGPPGSLTNTINADPMLGALANNGGRTLTMRPSSTSPALDAGATLPLVTTDQRGIARPQFAATDIGAVELAPADLPGVTTPDGARWILFGSLNGNQRIFRAAPGQGAVEVGGLGTSIGLQADGNVVVRDANGSVFTRIGSSNGVGSEWTFRVSIVAGDGATWFLGTDGPGSEFNIYRWTATGAPQFASGSGTRLVAVNGYAITQNAAGTVFLRTGSNVGFGSEWIVQSSAIAGDSATWFVGVTTVAMNGPIYRWAVDGSVTNSGGVAATLSRESGGTILARQTGGAIFSRLGSAGGIGTSWIERTRTTTADGAAWFLGTESTTADQRIYRWASNSGTAIEVGGQGTTLALQNDGKVLVRDSARAPYVRPGSTNSIGSDWVQLPYVITADSATWFVSTEPSGADRAIYRWLGDAAPANTTGAALSLVISPNGDVRATDTIGQVFQAIGSASGFSSNWTLLTESLVVTTNFDENDFSSSANLGNGTSLREAIDFASATPGPDTITFAPGLIASGQAVELAFGATGSGDDSAIRVASDLTIDGGGGATIRYIGAAGRRHFVSFAGSTFTLRNLTLTGGNPAGAGGAVLASGNLVVDNVRFQNNAAGSGGAIRVAGGATTITGSTFQNNTAAGTGGAIDTSGQTSVIGSIFANNSGGEAGAIQSDGDLSISTSTFSGNASNFNGGALRLFGTTTIDRSSFDANTVANEGGALINFGNLNVTNSTFANNGKHAVLIWDGTADLRHVTVAYNTDGGLLRVNADLTLRNSIVAGNAGFDLSGTLNAASSNNLLNLSANQARLGSLLNHGDGTSTIELLPGSPAINAGLSLAGINTDQRGTARPQGAAPDIGAFERAATSATVTGLSFEVQNRLAVNFSFSDEASVTFGRSAITLTNLGTNQAVSVGQLSWNSSGTAASMELSNLLPNGNYRAALGGQSVDFHVLAGDLNRDRSVNFDDLLVLAQNYGSPGNNSQGDVNYDAQVNFDDLLQLAQNYGQSLATATPMGTSPATSQARSRRKGSGAADVVA